MLVNNVASFPAGLQGTIANSHTHANKDTVLDKLGLGTEGQLQLDGQDVNVGCINITEELTLTADGWSGKTQTVTVELDTTMRNVVDIAADSAEEWANCGVYASAESATSVTFTCESVPTSDLKFRISSFDENGTTSNSGLKSPVKGVTVTLTVAGWSNNSQTVAVEDVTASSIILCSPAPEAQDNYSDAEIKCTAQADGSLTFVCGTTPTAAIAVNVVVI